MLFGKKILKDTRFFFESAFQIIERSSNFWDIYSFFIEEFL